MKEPNFPKQEEIEKVIGILKEKKPKGYLFSLKLLSNGANTYMFLAEDEHEWAVLLDLYQKQMQPINRLRDIWARSLAVIVNDFLNGVEEAKEYLMAM